jgi:hypothetical protein
MYVHIIMFEMSRVDTDHTQTEVPSLFDFRGLHFKKSSKPERPIEFSNSSDSDYQSLIKEVQRSLLFKVSAKRTLADLLHKFFDPGKFDFTLRGYLGQSQTPLHIAAYAGNFEAIKILTRPEFQRFGLATTPDVRKRIPLHIAVKQAAKIEVDDFANAKQETLENVEAQGNVGTQGEGGNQTSDKSDWKDGIMKLLEAGQTKAKAQLKDDHYWTAWDYALVPKERSWILDIETDWAMLTTDVLDPAGKQYGPVDKPKLTDEQKHACYNWEATLLDFTWKKQAKDGRYREHLTLKRPNIDRLIYTEQGAPKRILPSKLPGEDGKCRWIHLPANNASSNRAILGGLR